MNTNITFASRVMMILFLTRKMFRIGNFQHFWQYRILHTIADRVLSLLLFAKVIRVNLRSVDIVFVKYKLQILSIVFKLPTKNTPFCITISFFLFYKDGKLWMIATKFKINNGCVKRCRVNHILTFPFFIFTMLNVLPEQDLFGKNEQQ